jgi:hypothetical protein
MPALLASAGRRYSIQRFMAGRVGAFYTPDNPNTLSTSRTGASFGGLSASSAVGMMLDVSRGGLERLASDSLAGAGAFPNTTGWIADSGCTLAASGGVLTATTTADSVFAVQRNSVYATTKSYLVSFSYRVDAASTTARLRTGGTTLWSESGSVTTKQISVVIAPTTTQFEFGVSGGSVTLFELSALTVRELPGCHMVAPSDAARPVLEAFAGTGPLAARFNGTDRSMGSLTTLDLTSTDEVTVIAAVQALANASDQIIYEISSSWTGTSGTSVLYRDSANIYRFGSRGNSGTAVAGVAAFSQPDSALILCRAKISTPTMSFSRNRAAPNVNTASQGSGNYGNLTLFLGARNNASVRYNGQIGRLAIIGGALTTEELSIATALVAAPYGL